MDQIGSQSIIKKGGLLAYVDNKGLDLHMYLRRLFRVFVVHWLNVLCSLVRWKRTETSLIRRQNYVFVCSGLAKLWNKYFYLSQPEPNYFYAHPVKILKNYAQKRFQNREQIPKRSKFCPLSCWTRICPAIANSVDPDQLASEEANWSGSVLFAIQYVNICQQTGLSNPIGWQLEMGVAF